MGIFDIFKKHSSEYTTFAIKKPVYGTEMRICRSCKRRVKHTCIANYVDEDKGGMTNSTEIWAIATHRYKDRKCRGSNRRYKIHHSDY